MLPRLRPARVVLEAGVERARQCTGLALRSEAEVDSKGLALGRQLADGAPYVLRGLLGGGLSSGMHEHHVYVGGVVELPPSELAHPDHREGNLDACKRGLETRIGHIRQPGPHIGDAGCPGKIRERHSQHLAALEPSEAVETPL